MTVGIILALLASLMQLSPGGQAAKQGREGNDYLKAEQYGEASEAYQQGLSAYAGGREADRTYYGLQNNLGISLFRQEELEQAQAAFEAALAQAPTDLERARAAYNAGNTAFSQQAAEAALARYRSALLADPESEDARYNYEFVKRWIQEQQQQSDNNEQNEQEQQNQQQDQRQEEQDQQQEEQQQSEPEQQPQGSGEETESDARPQEPEDTQLTRQQAEQILEALENEEQELLREVQKVQGTRRRVAKDW